MLRINNRISIPQSEFRFTYSRSPGPGGQNVNKVNSKATLRWPLVGSNALPIAVKQRLLAQQKNRLTAEGDLLISSHRYRDQPRNVADCLAKLKTIVLAAVEVPKARKKTRVPAAVKRKRLQDKKRTAEKKRLRGRINRNDDR